MWMSDKPLTQQRLAHDLANLVTVLKGNDNFLGFINAFWKTMAREWSGIDALRMDKYLYLVRCYVGKGFEVMSARQWADEELLEKYLAVLEETPLNARDVRILNGMRFHVVDLYVDELDKVDGERSAPLEKILGPVRKLGRDSVTKPVGKRVKEALDDERLQDWQGLRSEEGSDSESVEGNEIMADADDDDDEFGGFDD